MLGLLIAAGAAYAAEELDLRPAAAAVLAMVATKAVRVVFGRGGRASSAAAEKAAVAAAKKADSAKWVAELRADPSFERVELPEWGGGAAGVRSRKDAGFKGFDLCHSDDSPARVLEYHFDAKGKRLVGVAYATTRAESHSGYAHGGAACSLADDAVGHNAFCAMGEAWGGATVQVNTALTAAIPVDSLLRIDSRVERVDGRKYHIRGKLESPEGDTVHATWQGMSIAADKSKPAQSANGKSQGSPAPASEASPSKKEKGKAKANGDAQPAANGHARPAPNGDAKPAANGHAAPAANGHAAPAARNPPASVARTSTASSWRAPSRSWAQSPTTSQWGKWVENALSAHVDAHAAFVDPRAREQLPPLPELKMPRLSSIFNL